MAHERVYDRWSTEWAFVADEAADVSNVESAYPDAPVGSWILVGDDDGVAAVYVKYPAGSFLKTFDFS